MIFKKSPIAGKIVRMSESEVFVLSIARADTAWQAVDLAARQAGLKPERIQDIFWSGSAAELAFPVVSVGRGGADFQQALHCAAQAILAGDVELALVGGPVDDAFAALVLCSPSPVGRLNLDPLLRIAARTLGPQAVARAFAMAEVEAADLQNSLEGVENLSLPTLLEQLMQRRLRYGLFASPLGSAGQLATLVERL